MKRLLILLSAFVIDSCTLTKQYGKEYVIESKKDKNGKVIYKKVKQLFVNREGEEYKVTSFQEFDTLGRKIKQYGFEGPQGGNKYLITIPGPNDKYLREYRYSGNYNYLSNTFMWSSKTDSDFTTKPQLLTQQTYIPDSTDFTNGMEEVTILEKKDSIITGVYSKKKSDNTGVFSYDKYYEFKIAPSLMQFDEKGRFIIEKVTKVRDYPPKN
jgi:hypothetical protein